MTCRFLFKSELSKLFENGHKPKDIESGHFIGVSEVCNYSLVIEDFKIAGMSEQLLKEKFENVTNAINQGSVWVLDLNSSNISRLLLDNDFYDSYCDKKSNPFVLSKRVCLFHDNDFSYWTENVYTEAFDL